MELRLNAGTQFDPRVVEALTAVIEPETPAHHRAGSASASASAAETIAAA
jgi:HD-GYP domain-containing protein (c-di-GMP phosphodiesterase class II)